MDANYAAWRRLDRLFRLRRHLGRFLYTRYLYTTNSLAGASEAYRDIMMDACQVDYPQEYYLLDWDWQYTSLTALRGWSLTYALLGDAARAVCRGLVSQLPTPGSGYGSTGIALWESSVEALRDQLTGSAWDGELFAAALMGEDV